MRTALLLAVVGLSTSLHGQGVIGFWNIGASPEQKVYIDQWLNPATLAPCGRQFLVALYFAPFGSEESAIRQVGDAAGFLNSGGIFSGGNRTVATSSPGGLGLFQVKGWEAAYGTTFEEAAANPAARVGSSPIFSADTADPTGLEPVGSLIEHSFGRFEGFVIAVPEPSSVILILTGVVTFAFCAYRKSWRRR